MTKIAVFPGSFDPFTVGHESIVKRSADLFDEIVIAIGVNSAKQGFFPVEQRKRWITELFANYPMVRVETFEGLTVNYCQSLGAKYILRGLRTAADFEYERMIAQLNQTMMPDIETILMLTYPEHSMVSSSIVREILRNGGDVSKFIPAGMKIN